MLARMTLNLVLLAAVQIAHAQSTGFLLWQHAIDPAARAEAAKGNHRLLPGAPLGGKAPNAAVRMAVIDSGVASSHPQLAGYIIDAVDFTGEGLQDVLGHGTAVALIALFGAGQPQPGTAIMSAKVVSRDERIMQEHVVKAIDWAVSKGARIVNLSLGFEGSAVEHAPLCDAMRRARDTLFVAAAGNSGPSVAMYPASCGGENLISVGALDERGKPGGSSGRGEIYAPGAVQFLTESQYHYEEAQTLARAGRLRAARKAYERSLALETNAGSAFQIGLISLRENNTAEAIKHLQHAVQIDPALAEAHEMLGAAYFLERDLERAERALRRSIDLYPDAAHTAPVRARAQFNLGQTLLASGRRSEALEAFRTVKSLAPRYPRIDEVLRELGS